MKSKIKSICKNVIISTLVIITGILPSISSVRADSNTTGYIWHDDWYLAYPQSGTSSEHESQLLVNGEEAFCIDPYTYFKPNVSMETVSWSTVGISIDTAKELSLISYFGTKVSGRTSANWYAVTQGLIWKILHPNDANLCYVTTPLNPDYATTQRLWNEILADVERYKTVPSFAAQTVEVDADGTITLNDTNNVLQDMMVEDSGGLNVTISGNQLIIKGNASAADIASITLTKKINVEELGTSLVFYNGVDQSLARFKISDPVQAKVRVKVNKFGELELIKYNDDKSAIVAGTTYRITGPDGYDQTFTTDANGKIKVERLKPGEYKAIETKASNGYLINVTEKGFTIEVNQTTNIEFSNNEPTGKITLTKSMDTTLTEGLSGDGHLKDNEYVLYAKTDIKNVAGTVTHYKKDEKVATKKTDVNGYLEFDNLPLGDYYIKESKSNETLYLNDAVINVSLQYEGETVNKVVTDSKTSNRPNMQKIRVFKSGEKDGISGVVKGLQGAEFTWKLRSEVDHVGWDNAQTYAVITTDAKGETVTPYLPNGQYQVRETKTPTDYITAPDFLISVTADYTEYKEVEQIKNVNVNNRPFTSQVKLVKADKDTGKTVTLNSASFKIKDSQGNYIVQKIGGVKYDTFTTNSTNNIVIPFGSIGEVTIPLQLDAGEYVIEEIEVPNGFLVLEEPVTFTITNMHDYDVDEDEDPILVVTVKNAQPKATIQLTKSFESAGHTEDKVAKFELQANKDIISVIDGSVLYKKGQAITNTETEDGYYYIEDGETLTIDNLAIGVGETSYVLKEVETAEGYVLSKDPIIYTFKQEDETTKVYEVSNSLENKLLRTDIQVAKTDAYTNEIIKDLEGFEFEMEMSFTHSDGTLDSTIEQATVDPKTGLATFKNIPYGASVSIKEIAVPEGEYYLSDEVKEFIVNKDIEGIGEVHTFSYENVPVEKIGTTAKDQLTGTNQGANREEVTIIDTVAYKNLSTEKKYTLKGTLMDKETGEPLLLEDKEITSEVTFTPEDHNGEIDIVFTVPGSLLEGKTTVVFERLYTEDKEVAVHTDIEDEGQTVYFPKVKTTAIDKESGTHNAVGDKEVTIIDTVHYENLIIGKEYEVKGVLMDKATNKPLLVNDKEITATTTFIAEETSGDIELFFTFDASALGRVTVVVFETLYQDGKEVASHTDINDEAQTVNIIPPVIPIVDTGDSTNIIMPILAIAVAAVISFVILRKKMDDDDNGRK